MKRDYVYLIQALDALHRLAHDVRASAGLKCPNCNDEGFTVEATSHTRWVDDPNDGEPVAVDEQELVQVQCEFCYTIPDSVFNRRNQAIEDDAEARNRVDLPHGSGFD